MNCCRPSVASLHPLLRRSSGSSQSLDGANASACVSGCFSRCCCCCCRCAVSHSWPRGRRWLKSRFEWNNDTGSEAAACQESFLTRQKPKTKKGKKKNKISCATAFSCKPQLELVWTAGCTRCYRVNLKKFSARAKLFVCFFFFFSSTPVEQLHAEIWRRYLACGREQGGKAEVSRAAARCEK